jgi:hypothetical protein
MIFLQYKRFSLQIKKPVGWSAGGLVKLDLSGLLVQAMAVRRHGCSMMVVMTVMVAALHLFQK